MTEYLVAVGTDTYLERSAPDDPRPSEGIYVLRMHKETGQVLVVESLGVEASGDNPGFVRFHQTKDGHRILIAANRYDFVDSKKDFAGAVSVFDVTTSPDNKRTNFELVNRREETGIDPAYFSVVEAKDTEFIVTANYRTASVSAFVLEPSTHRVSRMIQRAEHALPNGAKSGPKPDRQDDAHPHCAVPSPVQSGIFYVADLGTDEIYAYEMVEATALSSVLFQHERSLHRTTHGAGPRHLVFHPERPNIMYCTNELANTVSVYYLSYRVDQACPSLQLLQEVSTLPEDFEGENTNADLHVSPNSRFLLVSNRGHNSLATFEISRTLDENHLGAPRHVSTGGNWPRGFAITPNGRFVLCANQYSHNVVIFAFDQEESGALTPTGQVVEIPNPVSFSFDV